MKNLFKFKLKTTILFEWNKKNSVKNDKLKSQKLYFWIPQARLWIPQNHLFLVQFWAVQCFKYLFVESKTAKKNQRKVAKLRIPRQIWFLPVAESAYNAQNAQFGS